MKGSVLMKFKFNEYSIILSLNKRVKYKQPNMHLNYQTRKATTKHLFNSIKIQ